MMSKRCRKNDSFNFLDFEEGRKKLQGGLRIRHVIPRLNFEFHDVRWTFSEQQSNISSLEFRNNPFSNRNILSNELHIQPISLYIGLICRRRETFGRSKVLCSLTKFTPHLRLISNLSSIDTPEPLKPLLLYGKSRQYACHA